MSLCKMENKLALASFLSQGAIVIFNFTLVYYLRECNIDSVGIGIASSIYPTVYFLGCILMPKVLPSIKGKARIIIADCGMALTGIVLTLLRTESLIMIDLVIYGLFQSLLWTNMETWITNGVEGSALTSRLTLFNFSWSFSVGVATSCAGFLSEINTRYSIWTGVLAFLAASLIVAGAGKSYEKEKRGETKEEKGEDHSSPLRFPSWAGVLLVYTGYSLVLTVFPQYAMDSLGYSESVTGKGFLPIVLSQGAFIVLTLLMLVVKSIPGFALLFALYGAVFALSYDLSIFHGAEGARDRHRRMVIHEVLLTIGTIAGSLVGGFVYQYFSFFSLVLVIAATAFVSLIAEGVIFGKTLGKS